MVALVAYALGVAFFILAVMAGACCLIGSSGARPPDVAADSGPRWIELLCQCDGRWYAAVASEGYSYDPRRPSSVAFFPLYPLAACVLGAATGAPAEWTLVVISNACLLAAFLILAAYVGSRMSEAEPVAWPYALLAFGLFPTTFFFRMAYSESLFVLLCLVALFGMHRGWSVAILAVVVGAATATRPVGVALLPPLAWEAWRKSPSCLAALRRLAWVMPLAAWGLLAYAAFLGLRFGDPMAFAKTQENWRIRPPVSLGDKLLSLASWEPIWSAYDSYSLAYWGRRSDPAPAAVSLQFANPLYFLAAASLVALGAMKRWLTAPEILLSAGLLAIPYFTRSYEMCMMGHGRFAAVVVPMYLVLGRLLARMTPLAAYGILALSGFLMAVYAAMFAAGYVYA
ncbi:MAG: hypothetical protein NUV77_07790 [Thermoguttaceae bacterium]|nr:hypothetical protein [Thermoguttaceae bacterium]